MAARQLLQLLQLLLLLLLPLLHNGSCRKYSRISESSEEKHKLLKTPESSEEGHGVGRRGGRRSSKGRKDGWYVMELEGKG